MTKEEIRQNYINNRVRVLTARLVALNVSYAMESPDDMISAVMKAMPGIIEQQLVEFIKDLDCLPTD